MKKLINEKLYSDEDVFKLLSKNSIDNIIKQSLTDNDLSLLNYLIYKIQILCVPAVKLNLINEVEIYKKSIILTFNILNNIDNKYSKLFKIDSMYTHASIFELDRKEYDIYGLKDYYKEYIFKMNDSVENNISQSHIDMILRNLQLLIDDLTYVPSFHVKDIIDEEFYTIYKLLVIDYISIYKKSLQSEFRN